VAPAILEDNISALFTVFEQVKESNTRSIKGSGLGLAFLATF
jgi:signal transduction histidine kinase